MRSLRCGGDQVTGTDHIVLTQEHITIIHLMSYETIQKSQGERGIAEPLTALALGRNKWSSAPAERTQRRDKQGGGA